MNITMLSTEINELPLPFWMTAMFGTGIFWFIFATFLCSLICWKIIFGNASDTVVKADQRASIFKSWLTAFLCNFLSCVLLLIVEFAIRNTTDKYSMIRLDSLRIWDSFLTVAVYSIPVIISFIIIFRQMINRGYYMVSDKTPIRIGSWLMAIFTTPWFILVPTSLVQDISDFIQSGGNVFIE